jgi:repressor LexA
MKKGITKRQKEFLRIIFDYIKDTGFPPTFEEMREDLGVASNQSILDLLNRLKDGKYIQRSESEARSIVILPAGYKALDEPPLVAFLGAASAGALIEAIEITGSWQTLQSFSETEKIEKLNNNVFLLKICGDSMINAGIDDGDVVMVQEQKEFISGDVVLASIGDEVTIKRFISDDNPPYVYLKPENSKYENILFTDETELKGKVFSVLKNGYWKPVR